MRCKILHESGGRIRIHINMCHMTMAQADQLESYLLAVEGVWKAQVNERTANALIFFRKENRGDVIRAMAAYDPQHCTAVVPERSGRALQRQFEDRMFYHVAGRMITRWFFPVPLRKVWTAAKSVPYLWRGLRTIRRGKIEVPILDAASILVSMLRGDFDTAGSVMFLLQMGDIMDDWTHRKSVDDLARAMSLNVDKVWTVTGDGQEVLANIRDIKAGDVVIVRTGSMIPLDGCVCDGEGAVNQASITGEGLPVHKKTGSLVYAGTVVEEGELRIEVTQAAGSGRYDRIVAMIEESEKMKSAAEDKASHLADRLVPYTMGAAALTWLLTRNATKATSILMVDFSCALKLSMPIAVLSAMREAGEYHISVKGGKFLEAVAEARTIVFDKTGTLTHASPRVADVVSFGGNDGNEMLRLAACLEEHYPHSIANAVVQEARKRGLLHEEKHSKVEYIVAHGIASSIDGQKVRIGSHHFIFEDEKCRIPEGEEERFEQLPPEFSHLYLAIGGMLSAVILIEDPVRQEAPVALRKLRERGFDKIVMMTGDSERTAAAIAGMVGVDEYYSEVLPDEKAAFIQEEHRRGRRVIMVGDGVNDAPALSEADAGIAISDGAAIAREVADITIAAEDLNRLVILRELAENLMRRIHGNYRTILSFNSLLILMGLLGVLPPTMTALLHNASTIEISLAGMRDYIPAENRNRLPQPLR